MLEQNIRKTILNRGTKTTEHLSNSLTQRNIWQVSIISLVILKNYLWPSSSWTRQWSAKKLKCSFKKLDNKATNLT